MKEQIEEMAEIMRHSCEKDCKRNKYGEFDCEFCEAELLYNAGYRKQSEWISVEDRLPTWEDGKVLAFTEYGFSICERTVNGRWQGKHANWITYWMPLPEPPKMKGGE